MNYTKNKIKCINVIFTRIDTIGFETLNIFFPMLITPKNKKQNYLHENESN